MSKSLDGVLIKKPHQKVRWTEEQLIDFKECADPKSIPFILCPSFSVSQSVEGKMLYRRTDQETLVES